MQKVFLAIQTRTSKLLLNTRCRIKNRQGNKRKAQQKAIQKNDNVVGLNSGLDSSLVGVSKMTGGCVEGLENI